MIIKRTEGSLARRVLLAGVLILGIPLIVHTVFLYRREYRENLTDAFSMLHQLALSKVDSLEQMIGYQQDLLSGLSDNLPEDSEDRDAFMKKEAPEYHIGEFRVLELNPELPEIMQQETFVFIDREQKKLLVGRRWGRHAVFFITTPLDRLLSFLSGGEWGYPVFVSLIDEDGAIFLTSDPRLLGERYGVSDQKERWVAESAALNSWFLESDQGRFLAVALAVKETKYALMLTIPERNIADIQIQDYVFRIGLFLFLICIIGGGVLFWFTKRVSRPLRSLLLVMQRVSEGAAHLRYQKDRMGFEINILGMQFNQMLDSLFASQKEAEQERSARERLAQELKIGHEIQQSMLPKDFSIPSLAIAPGYHAALEVSGDFYDLFLLKDGRLLIAIADAAGKGISACLFSLSFRSMLRTAAEGESNLEQILYRANELLLQDTALSSFFITAWVGLYDPQKRELSYCSQGHPPALLYQEGKMFSLSTHGMALGAFKIEPKIEKVQMQSGDLLFLYTDGVIEAHNQQGVLFGAKRLESFLQTQKGHPVTLIADTLLKEINQFCEGAPQADDLTFLLIQIVL